MDDDRLKQLGGGNYFDELLSRIRDIRSSEKVFWRKVLEIYATSIDYNPHVFTEQGLYMLMTVLKGPLAVKQSKALIRTFKKMEDYILENRDLIGQWEILQLSMETANNRIEINKINSDMISLEFTIVPFGKR